MLSVLFSFFLVFPLVFYLYCKDIKKSKNNLHLYGIYGFFGLPGKGKTMCMTKYLNDLRKKYGDKIYIMTNYFYKGQDIEFVSWKQLLLVYDKPLVVAWDEVQNEFNSRDFKSFPIQLLSVLTQVRKGHGIQILYTAQRYHFVDKNFRSLTFGCYDCGTFFNRFTFALKYDTVDYEEKVNQVDFKKRKKIRSNSHFSFIQTDKLRECYDSFKMLNSAREKQYMTREEIAIIEGGKIDT